MDIEKCDYKKVMEIFQELDFKSLFNKIPKRNEQKYNEQETVKLNFSIDNLKSYLKDKNEIFFTTIKKKIY
ncbi:hypothetical protein PL321_15440 [Caloramator sp. mosi_1]|nr:hypothetical protein [Caloramator sp. mosi_1]WDC83854.1 hypothetical protein PL321_15440 [Caloramator sp. mosi_1]